LEVEEGFVDLLARAKYQQDNDEAEETYDAEGEYQTFQQSEGANEVIDQYAEEGDTNAGE
ncbi:hypothetical protein B0A55_13690, partial [Friedmanniomyces simplex]